MHHKKRKNTERLFNGHCKRQSIMEKQTNRNETTANSNHAVSTFTDFDVFRTI